MLRRFSVLLLTLAFTAVASSALADDADKAACVDLDEGDDCTRGDGGPGTCLPDESDADVLTCDDDPSGASGSSSSSCAVGDARAQTSTFGVSAVFALVGIVVAARQRGRRGRRHCST